MKTRIELKQKRNEILDIAAKYGINNIKVFGSVARGESNQGSDIDFLVNFEEGRTLFDLIGFKNDLEELLSSKVDVVSENAIHWYLKDRIVQEAVEI
jgi:predicted nucleotidyltransferase